MKAAASLALATYFGLSSAGVIGARDGSLKPANKDSKAAQVHTSTKIVPAAKAAVITSAAHKDEKTTEVRTSFQPTWYTTDVVSEFVTTCTAGQTLTVHGKATVLPTPSVFTTAYTLHKVISTHNVIIISPSTTHIIEGSTSATIAQKAKATTAAQGSSEKQSDAVSKAEQVKSTSVVQQGKQSDAATKAEQQVKATSSAQGSAGKQGQTTTQIQQAQTTSETKVSTGKQAIRDAHGQSNSGNSASEQSESESSESHAQSVGGKSESKQHQTSSTSPSPTANAVSKQNSGYNSQSAQNAKATANVNSESVKEEASVSVSSTTSSSASTTVDVYTTVSGLCGSAHTQALALNNTIAGFVDTPSSAEILIVNTRLAAITTLVTKAKTTCTSGTLSLSSHSASDVSALVSKLLLEVEYTASHANQKCGKPQILTALTSLSTACTTFVNAVATVSTSLKSLVSVQLKAQLSASSCVLTGVAALI